MGEVGGDPHTEANFEVNHFDSPGVVASLGKPVLGQSPLHRHTVQKPDPSAEPNRPGLNAHTAGGFRSRRPEKSFPARSSYHGRRSKVEQGVPVPETGKLNRKLRSQLRFGPPPLGQERAPRIEGAVTGM